MATVTVVRPEPVPPVAYTLELSAEEMLTVTASVGASTRDCAYPLYEDLRSALLDAGYSRKAISSLGAGRR